MNKREEECKRKLTTPEQVAKTVWEFFYITGGSR